jgi:ABC-2 type transport system ATP-binding protein
MRDRHDDRRRRPAYGRDVSAIEVEDLFKRYDSVDAVRGISFRVQEGEVFALLGPNGAGKTTTLEFLEGHRRRSGGRVSVLGVDPELGGRSFRERIGIVLQSAGIDAELTVREVLALYAASYPCSLPVGDVIAVVGLEDKGRARVKTLSGGQRRRLDLALALIGDPDLIFLDEPTTGLDPAARRGAWGLIERLRRLGRTIVLTSHYMDEVQHLADRVAVIRSGRIAAQGSPDSLGRTGPRESVISFRLPVAQTLDQLPYELRRVVESEDGEVKIRTTEPVRVLARLCEWALEREAELPGLEVVHTSLEDVYLRLTEDGPDEGNRA